MEIKTGSVSHTDIAKADTAYRISESVSGESRIVISGIPITPIDALIEYLKQDSVDPDNGVWNWGFQIELIKNRR